MSRYQIISLVLAILIAACYVGAGVFIAEGSTLGVITCLAVSVGLMGVGFSLKRKYLS